MEVVKSRKRSFFGKIVSSLGITRPHERGSNWPLINWGPVFVEPESNVSGESDGADTNTYQDCSKRIACSWFSANPVYCLRSQYIYQHSPPCLFCIPGKEHLIEVNEDIGLYFNDCAAKDLRSNSCWVSQQQFKMYSRHLTRPKALRAWQSLTKNM